eukprot:7680671-Ditylum_brightwellii.AAC.1
MACFVCHTKSCLCGRLTLVLAHGRRSLSSAIVQLALVVSSFVFGAIGRHNCSPSRESSLGLPFEKEVQWTCFVV